MIEHVESGIFLPLEGRKTRMKLLLPTTPDVKQLREIDALQNTGFKRQTHPKMVLEKHHFLSQVYNLVANP